MQDTTTSGLKILGMTPAFKATLLLMTLLLGAPRMVFALDVNPAFNPNMLIPDAAFADTRTFGGPEGIQKFLDSKNALIANTSPDFLSKLLEPNDPALKAKLDDPQPNLGRLRTAAELIWDASRASGLNPQVIIVTLNKEQGLITQKIAPDRVQRALNFAMGFDCPDSSACGTLFPGFYFQLFGNVDTEGNRYLGAAKSLMKSFNTPGGRGPTIANAAAKVGQSVLIHNTMGDYTDIFASQYVTIGNRATAALYRYTPHVFNGNYNFWRFFTSWFKYPNGTLLTSTFDSAVYIVQNGSRLRVPGFVASARALDLTTAIGASPTELESYPLGGVYGPPDDTVVDVGGTYYVFKDGVRRPVSAFVLTQRKLDTVPKLGLQGFEAEQFPLGAQLTPTDGTVLKGATSPDVYLVEGGTLKKYSWFTFTQHKAATKLQTIPDSEVASYPKLGYVAPLNGTVIRGPGSTETYVVSAQRRLPLTPELYKNLTIQAKSIVTLETMDEIGSIPIGPPATPKDGTYFSYGNAYEFFLFKDGAKHWITPTVAKQRGMTPDYVFEASVAGGWPEGIAIPPRNGSVVKSTAAATTYLVENGQLRELVADIARLRGLSKTPVLTIPEAEFSAFAKSGTVMPPENTYFTAGKDGKFYIFMGGAKRLVVPFVAKQKGMTPDYVFPAVAVESWPDGVPVAPREGTLLKAEGTSTIYLVSQKLLRPLSTLAFAKRGYKMANVRTVPAAELDVLAKGELIAK